MIGHFGYNSFQAIDCTATDKQKQKKQRNKITHAPKAHKKLAAS